MARRRGPKTPRISVSYEDAPDDVKELAGKVITESHGFLAQAQVGYLIRKGKWSRKGNLVFAAVRRPGPEERHFHGLDYILTINDEVWHQVPEKTREAIIDEQFCLCVLDDKTGKFGLGAPDVQANNMNVRRYGAWWTEFGNMVKAIQEGFKKTIQTRLPIDDEELIGQEAVIMAAEMNDGDIDHGQGTDDLLHPVN